LCYWACCSRSTKLEPSRRCTHIPETLDARSRRTKRRLHKRPNAYEIERCRWWVDRERALVAPAVIVALGATAAQSLLGRTVVIAALRRRAHALPDGTPVFVTVHPSYLLRIREEADRTRAFRAFVADLQLAKSAYEA
jgi:uracil-DNA glycosylase family 4